MNLTRLTGAPLLAACLLFSPAAHAQTPPQTRTEEYAALENRTGQLVREGERFTAAQAAEAERSLVQTPDDLDRRGRLLGFYFSPASQSLGVAARVEARRRHILWLVNHQPDSMLLVTPQATIDAGGQPLGDAEGYRQVRAAWLEQTAKSDANVNVVAGAARFFYLPDKALAVQLYGRARRLDPDNEMWVGMQGSAMAFAIAGIEGMNQNGLPGPANAAEAESAFAVSARRELETSKDAALVFAAAGDLMARGVVAQSISRQSGKPPAVDALQLSETLLKRVEELEPGKPQAGLELARLYELRGMRATEPAEKAAMAKARYEQLAKAAAAAPADAPVDSMQLTVLGAAALDVGELQVAQRAGRQALDQVPNLKADPKQSWSVDMVVHHAYLILGRVALRQGDMAAAEADLLNAGRVGGGGTLSSFGPNMTLAKELLEKGESATVLEYFELCRKFWMFSDRMQPWIDAIHKGQLPEFGANLSY